MELEERRQRRLRERLGRLEVVARPRWQRRSRFFEFNQVTVETVYRMGSGEVCLDRPAVDAFLDGRQIVVAGGDGLRSQLVRPRSNSCSNADDVGLVVQGLCQFRSFGKRESCSGHKVKLLAGRKGEIHMCSSNLKKFHLI